MTALLQHAELELDAADSLFRHEGRWAATAALNIIDSYLGQILYLGMPDSSKGEAVASMATLLMLEMTACYILPQQHTSSQQQAGQLLEGQLQQHEQQGNHEGLTKQRKDQKQQHEVEQQQQQQPPQHRVSTETSVDADYRRAQLSKLAESLVHAMGSSWGVDFFPAAQFDASVRQHALRQLAACIKVAGEVGHGCVIPPLHLHHQQRLPTAFLFCVANFCMHESSCWVTIFLSMQHHLGLVDTVTCTSSPAHFLA